MIKVDIIEKPPVVVVRDVVLTMPYEIAVALRTHLGKQTTHALKSAGIHELWDALYRAGVDHETL